MATSKKITTNSSVWRNTSNQEYTLWEDIKKQYPDRFVLLENPVYNPPCSPFLMKGIFRYKNKSPKKVAEKAAELALPLGTIKYTGGPLLDNAKDYIFVL
jgi:hypothetical protein